MQLHIIICKQGKEVNLGRAWHDNEEPGRGGLHLGAWARGRCASAGHTEALGNTLVQGGALMQGTTHYEEDSMGRQHTGAG